MKRYKPTVWNEWGKPYSIALAIVMVVGALCFWYASDETPVKASSDCPVQSSTPDNNGGATVVFNCQAYIITIHEPVWP
jgi:hypothetical protein